MLHCPTLWKALKILVPMDSGRYADVLINITAAVLIFYLPGGYTLPLLIALVLSHVYLGDKLRYVVSYAKEKGDT